MFWLLDVEDNEVLLRLYFRKIERVSPFRPRQGIMIKINSSD